MMYKVRQLLRLLRWARGMTNRIVKITGFMFLFVVAWVAFANILAPLEPGAAQIDVRAIVNDVWGIAGYVFIFVVITYLVSHAAPYVLRFRNWWIHNESHKITRTVFRDIWEDV